MLFTQDELEQLRQGNLGGTCEPSCDSPVSDAEPHVLWADEPSDLFRGGNEFWELYPTVN